MRFDAPNPEGGNLRARWVHQLLSKRGIRASDSGPGWKQGGLCFSTPLAIPWEYEKEGFKLPSGRWFLPDFYFPIWKLFAEVKPESRESDRQLCREFRDGIGAILLLTGMPCGMEKLGNGNYTQRSYKLFCFRRSGSGESASEWDVVFGGYRDAEMGCLVFSDQGSFDLYSDPHFRNELDVVFEDTGALSPFYCLQAQAAARSARFEHGETV